MNLFKDLESHIWIHIKGWLFLALSFLACIAVLIQLPSLQNTFLLFLAMWGAARWYYYMFYVVSKYVDPSYRFAGLIDFMKYLASKRKSPRD
jgi:hypothetical protein